MEGQRQEVHLRVQEAGEDLQEGSGQTEGDVPEHRPEEMLSRFRVFRSKE